MDNQRQLIIGNHYFAQASSECQLTFKYGCYFACITLCQSVAEAYARFLYENWTNNPPCETFGANINKMINAGVQPDVSSLLKAIYGGQQRQDFHHLNKDVPTDYEQLGRIATEKLKLLNKVETQIWENAHSKNGMTVEYPQYWEIEKGCYKTYLRLDP